jgi:4-hydroxy-3-polyprenylbenzoate decarboxylase
MGSIFVSEEREFFMQHILVAMTGASGAVYGLRLVEELLAAKCRVTLLLSRSGRQVLTHETGLDWQGSVDERLEKMRTYFGTGEQLMHYDEEDMFAPPASGSAAPTAMVVIPCSMGTVGRLATGVSGNLIERAADVAMKEGRTLLLVPRETPLSVIHLENMLRLARAGARIVPAMPAFYQKPESLTDLVDFVVGKVLDGLDVEHSLFRRWGDDAL